MEGTRLELARGRYSELVLTILDTESRPASAPIKFTPKVPSSHPLVQSHSGPPLATPVLPYLIPHDISVFSFYSSSSSRLPMGTIGFSRVLRRNFSLKLSGVL